MSAWQNGIKSAGVLAVNNGPSTTTGASMAHCFVMVRLKTAKEVWCIYLLVRFVLFRRYRIIAALLEPAKRGLTARAVAQRAAAALLQVLGRRGRSVGGRLSE